MKVARSYSDAEVIIALKDSKQMDAAIRFLYEEYYGLLEHYVINNKGTRDDAADTIQETMVAFIGIIEQGKFRGDASIKSFLYSITRNVWLAELRKRSSSDNRNHVFETAKETTEKETVQHLMQREQYSFIVQLFEKLGSKCRQLLLLVYFENLSMSDILLQMTDYENEQVLRNKKYKCMKGLETMMQENETLRTQFKNALKHAG